MELIIPSIQFASGKIFCLHIPQEYRGGDRDIENSMLLAALGAGRTVIVAHPAEIRQKDTNSLNETSIDWLSRTAGISPEQSAKKIAGLGIKVAEKLAYNAGTERALLGIVAALANEPEVLIYAAQGLDDEGYRRVHRYIRSNCQKQSVVHISHPLVSGDGSPVPRRCPEGARCLVISSSESSGGAKA